MDINFSKYKRFFAFGCSFTHYYWPTWANILHQEMPDAEFHNLGLSGAGNQFIASRIPEADRRFKFCDTDLIMVLWTTHCREDRYMGDRWITPGNIFTQGVYDEEFVRKFADPFGYLVKDLALISLTNAYLKASPATCFTMTSVRYDDQQEDTEQVRELLELYADTVAASPIDMQHSVFGDNWGAGHTYLAPVLNDSQPRTLVDNHPNPIQHYTYLKNIGMPLTDASFVYATKTTDELLKLKTRWQIVSWSKLLTPSLSML